jgi:ubiquitin carboxyl-terminal hydrolase 6/32
LGTKSYLFFYFLTILFQFIGSFFGQAHQLAVKKLQIWRLPPILIVHLKRFQCVNDRWIKSHKIVDFPVSGLDLTDYLAAVPAATLHR